MRSRVSAHRTQVEIIVVDDGSTDDTPQIIETLSTSWPSARTTRAGRGAQQRSRVCARTVVAFLDDDDLWMPHKLRHHLQLLEEHPNASVVLGHTAFQGLDPETGAWNRVAEPHLLYHLGAALCRREVFDRIGTFDPALRNSEDVDWFLRVRDAGLEIVVTPEIAQIHRRNGQNMTRGKDLRELGFIEVVKRSLDRRRAQAAGE